MRYIGAIAAAVIKNKRQRSHRIITKKQHPIHTVSKEQHLKWLEEGKCQCCGAEEGENKGICDECRFS